MREVDFAVKNTLLKRSFLGSNGSPSILILFLNITKGPATNFRSYTQTLTTSGKKHEFYGNLTATIEAVSKSKQMFLLIYFSARVGDDSTS